RCDSVMNICFISREYPPETHGGGIGTYTHNTASALARLGHLVHVVTATQDQEKSYLESGVWVHRIKSRRIRPKELWLMKHSLSVAKRISRLPCHLDIVQASEFESEAFWYARRRKAPLITRLSTPYFLIEQLNSKVFWGPRPFFNWMEKKQVLRSDGIFTSTRALARVAVERWAIQPARVEIIPNSVDLSRVVRLGKDRDVPQGLMDKDFLLYFGRLEERKGIPILAQALPPVFKRFPHLHAVFVGADLGCQGSSMRKYIRHQTGGFQERLIFFDHLPQERLFPMVNLAKIIVLPSIWEAFGFVCLEAMALGGAVVATSGSGFEEIIEDGISGYLVKPGQAELLAEKIIQVLSNEQDLPRISEGARMRAQEFDVSKVALRLLAYYKKTREEWRRKKSRV
ncbi:MAG: glycosyltransferase family 4 protein, partial [Candidatus Aminicenantes bacterium]